MKKVILFIAVTTSAPALAIDITPYKEGQKLTEQQAKFITLDHFHFR